MAYTIAYSGGTFTVNDGTLNTTSTSISLPGRNYPGYGQPMDQNLVYMLENWASSLAGPFNPLKGQTWYDLTNTVLKFNVGTPGSPVWKTIATIGDNVTFNNIIATGNINGVNIYASNVLQGNQVESTGNFKFSVASVVAAGTTQGTATPISKDINVVTSSTTGVNDGVILPVTTGGNKIVVINQDGVDAVKVYPALGVSINGASANAAYSLAAGARLEFVSISASLWYTLNATYA